jgi:3-oxoacid CoA-transferase subunit B
VDLTVLGALEVSENGDIANWMIPGKMVKGMGGAMDLVAGARRVIVTMTHTSKAGAAKVLKECQLPITGKRCVDMIVTNYGVFMVGVGGLTLVERAEDVSVEQIRESTEANFQVADDLGVLPV